MSVSLTVIICSRGRNNGCLPRLPSCDNIANDYHLVARHNKGNDIPFSFGDFHVGLFFMGGGFAIPMTYLGINGYLSFGVPSSVEERMHQWLMKSGFLRRVDGLV